MLVDFLDWDSYAPWAINIYIISRQEGPSILPNKRCKFCIIYSIVSGMQELFSTVPSSKVQQANQWPMGIIYLKPEQHWFLSPPITQVTSFQNFSSMELLSPAIAVIGQQQRHGHQFNHWLEQECNRPSFFFLLWINQQISTTTVHLGTIYQGGHFLIMVAWN